MADVKARFEEMGHRVHFISGKTGEGIEELMEAVREALEEASSHGKGS